MKAITLFCLVALLATHTYAQCVLSGTVASFGASCSTNTGCSLTATLISTLNTDVTCALSALLGGVNLVIAPTGSGVLNIQLATSGLVYSSLNITANPGVAVRALASTTMSVANALYLAGNTTLTVASGTVVTVGTNLQVAADATLNVAGNVSANTAIAVSGTVQFAGTRVGTAAQTAWVVLKNTAASASISFSGTATIRGNGGFDGSVDLTGNASVLAGNSPGTVFVSGNLDMDPFTTLEIDVDGLLDHDLLIIQKQFNRDGILYAKFENNYVPNKNDRFTFATHASASGDFKLSHGNYFDRTSTKVKPGYSGGTTYFTYSSASSVAASLVLLVICSLLVL